MSIVLLFGAGASYGSGECSPKPPPLGKDLFPELLAKRGIAATLNEEERRLFEGNFEEGMARFIETRNIDIPILLREMSEYFLQFVPGPKNLYRKVVDQLRQRQLDLGEVAQRVVFATTNYDLLLEHAIIDSGGALVYPGVNPENDLVYAKFDLPRELISGPIPRHSRFAHVPTEVRFAALEVLKVHGSCNFLPDIPPEAMRGVTYQGVQVAIEAPVRATFPPDEVLNYLSRSDSSLAPAISMYAQGKQVLFSADYVREHQRRFQDAVKAADKIFLVGIRVSPEDTHIWDYIADSKAWLGYVGFEDEEFRTWCEAKDRPNHHFLAASFEDAIPIIEREIDGTTG